MAHDRHHQAARRLGRDAQMQRFVLAQNPGFIVIAGVDLRVIRQGLQERLHEKGQQGQLGQSLLAGRIQMGAQIFEFRDIHLLDIGDVRDVALGGLHLFSDLAAQADDLGFAHAVAGLGTAGRLIGGERRFGIGDEILALNAPGRPRTLHLAQVHANLRRLATNGGRRQGTLSRFSDLGQFSGEVARGRRARMHAHGIGPRLPLGLWRRRRGRLSLDGRRIFGRLAFGQKLDQGAAHRGHGARLAVQGLHAARHG